MIIIIIIIITVFSRRSRAYTDHSRNARTGVDGLLLYGL
jgi:hypothetical protein